MRIPPHLPFPQPSFDHPVLGNLARTLAAEGIEFAVFPGTGGIIVPVAGEHLAFHLIVDFDPATGLLHFGAMLPVRVPAHQRGAARQIVARLNDTLREGDLHLDPDGGEITFTLTHWTGDHGTDRATVKNLLSEIFAVFDNLAPSLCGVFLAPPAPARRPHRDLPPPPPRPELN